MLSIKNVHKSFGNNEILKGVDLSIDKGDVVVILGPSGSGKTTLLRCLNFLEKADQGHATFGEIDVDLHDAKKKTFMLYARKLHLSFKTTIYLTIKLHLKTS